MRNPFDTATIRETVLGGLRVPRSAAPDILGILVILLTSWSMTFGLERVVDIALYDESAYLWRGTHPTALGGLDAAWGPLYSSWYGLLSLASPDLVHLYYLNIKLLNVLPALCLYAFLRAQKVRAVIGVCAASLLVVAAGNLYTVPRMNHLGLCVLFGGLFLASLTKTPSLMWGIVSLTALALSYIRPECYVAFGLAVAVQLWMAVTHSDRWRYASLLAVAALALFLLPTVGFPLRATSGRSFLAFQQHFALNWVNWHAAHIDPMTDYAKPMHDCFGDSTSTLQCLLSNPSAIGRHMLSNVLAAPRGMIDLFARPACFADENARYARVSGGHFLSLILLAVLAFSRFRVCKIRNTYAEVHKILLAATILVTPACMGVVLISPRMHYLLLLSVTVLAACLVLLRDCSLRTHCSASLAVIGMGFVFLMQAPPMVTRAPDLPVCRTLDFLKSLEVTSPVHLLEAEGGLCIYLGTNWTRVAQYHKDGAFGEFARRTDINAILVTKLLTEDSRFRSDGEWASFLSRYASQGFEKIAVPRTPWHLLVKRDLLGRNGATTGRQGPSEPAETQDDSSLLQ